METSLQSPPSTYCEASQPETSSPCNIVTFYEDLSDATRAVLNSDRITQAFSGGRPVRSSSWSFHLLGKQELNSLILQDASHADVLVVASHGQHALPERVASWVTMCMAADQAKNPVLVALHDENLETEEDSAPLCQMLKCIASRTHATFMCNRDIASAPHPTPTLPTLKIAQHAAGESVRRWGIND